MARWAAAATCAGQTGSSHGQTGSSSPPDRGRSPLFRVCPAGSWEQLWFLVVHNLNSHLRRYYCTTSTSNGTGRKAAAELSGAGRKWRTAGQVKSNGWWESGESFTCSCRSTQLAAGAARAGQRKAVITDSGAICCQIRSTPSERDHSWQQASGRLPLFLATPCHHHRRART